MVVPSAALEFGHVFTQLENVIGDGGVILQLCVKITFTASVKEQGCHAGAACSRGAAPVGGDLWTGHRGDTVTKFVKDGSPVQRHNPSMGGGGIRGCLRDSRQCWLRTGGILRFFWGGNKR